MSHAPSIEATTILWRLAITLLFVLLNGFFVAAEFALVKVRRARMQALADAGSGRARVVCAMLQRMGFYLSACQFGITVASLILGWLAEPAVANLLLVAAGAIGMQVTASPWLHAVALGIALAIVTTLHMTIGEQAPKIWAIQRAETLALWIGYPLRLFTLIFGPLIWVINRISNGVLRIWGISPEGHEEGSFSAEEIVDVLAASAKEGHITARQRQFAENVLGFIDLQVRHILVPRVDVVELSARRSAEENVRIIRDSSHSRLPLCEDDLDAVLGIIHTKDVLGALADGEQIDLRALARPAVFVPDTQPLGRMIYELQQARAKSAIVLDDHGTAIGMVFLEDALEEIVGPIQDEFDDEEPGVREPAPGIIEMRGDLPLPEALDLLGIEETGVDDTIGGHVISLIRRLPKQGDTLDFGSYHVTITEVSRRRVRVLRFERSAEEPQSAG